MNLSINYLASVFNSTLRYMTPLLLVTLCAGVCSKARVFNIGLEGTLLMSAFFAFLTLFLADIPEKSGMFKLSERYELPLSRYCLKNGYAS